MNTNKRLPLPMFMFSENRALNRDGSYSGECTLAAERVLNRNIQVFPDSEDPHKTTSSVTRGMAAALEHARNFQALRDVGFDATGMLNEITEDPDLMLEGRPKKFKNTLT